MRMENNFNSAPETSAEELSALARIFALFLGKRSRLFPELMAELGSRIVTARNEGDSFITLDEKEIEAVKANPHLLTGDEALLVLEGKRLYLFREYHSELSLANSIAQRLQAPPPEKVFSREEILQTFTIEPHERQIAAVENALSSNFSIISGGPGTGKTTIIAALVNLEVKRNPAIVIEIAAPTGKAAELLTAGLARSCPDYPVKAGTLHSLFKARPGSGSFQKNSASPLECDLLIVDECSMISLDTAAKMFKGLSPHTRVVLSGDHRQLEAIGSGAVLSSLLTFVSDGSSEAEKLKKCSVELTANYRSKSAPMIQDLAKAIREEDDNARLSSRITESSSDHYTFKKTQGDSSREIIAEAVKKWGALPRICSEITEESLKEAFSKLKSFRVVTAARVGKEGCEMFNSKILDALALDSLHAPGSALLITRNSSRTGVSNGDVGIVFADQENGGVKVFFEHLAAPLSLHDLPPHESAFAITVHKAQGSGFDEVCFPLPSRETPLLTRELFYTALTRAARKITIFGTPQMVMAALSQESCRATTLTERIIAQLKVCDEK